MKREITLSGGFHNSAEITIEVDTDKWNGYQENRSHQGGLMLSDILTNHQIKILELHFCGISDCDCSGYLSAKIED